ncbi:G protein-coupled receptor 88 [Microcaecilia unicolor]|uniref:Probable G-protein coupled receptor 88 n=1 Tax=Microcaecilia unicolor TaxID=1415580 RepID=A0A6P7YLE2_9AMPH|nr:probable G-protein coupled receptor 88 [Microcaecilia unicolor]
MTNSSLLVPCEDSSGTRILVSVLYSLFSISGTVANLVVIYLVCSFKRLKTTSNAFIVNGCVSDLLVCAFWMPQEAIVISRSMPESESSVYQVFTEGLVFLWMTVSLLSHSLIAINRYVLITKVPTVYQTIYQKRNTEWMIAMSWVIPLVFLLPWLLGQRRQARPSKCANSRLFVFTGKEVHVSGSYTAILSAMTILMQTLVLLYCYFKIFRKVQSSVKRVSVLNFQIINNLPYSVPRKEKRLGVYVLSVCCAFVFSTAPFMWVTVFALFKPVTAGLQTASWLLLCLLFVLNPFIYTCKNEEFRRSFRSVARGEFCKSSSVGVVVDPVIPTISHHEP